MSGKEYVKNTIVKMRELIEGLKDSHHLESGPALGELDKSVESLESLKNKATLRTKAVANMAFQVMDAALKLEDAIEDDEDADTITELCESFTSNVSALQASLKKRTVIMT